MSNLESNQPTSIADGRDDRGESKGPSAGLSGLRAHPFSGAAKGFQPTEQICVLLFHHIRPSESSRGENGHVGSSSKMPARRQGTTHRRVQLQQASY